MDTTKATLGYPKKRFDREKVANRAFYKLYRFSFGRMFEIKEAALFAVRFRHCGKFH